jgi:uncharacterized membrane protein YfcA
LFCQSTAHPNPLARRCGGAEAPAVLANSDAALLVAAGFAAQVMNSLAGGGTILTFPVLVRVLGDTVRANATSTVALVPGAVASLWGYRREAATHREWFRTLLIPSLLGGTAGSLLLLATPERVFASLAPWLVFGATMLFLFQIVHARRGGRFGEGVAPSRRMAVAWAWQFAVGVYGGYFGAGIGILMLVALEFLGLTDIHAMNGLKAFFGASINAMACVCFIVAGLVDWRAALLVMGGAIAGGLAGAMFARHIGREKARWSVVVVGLGVTAVMLWEQHG